jgi:hypothetical protein
MIQRRGRVDNAIVDFATMNRYLGGSAKAQLNAVAVDFQDDHFNIVADTNGFLRLTSQDEHNTTSLHV